MGADLHNTERELEDRERKRGEQTGGSDERAHGGMRRARDQAVCLGVDSMETKRLQ